MSVNGLQVIQLTNRYVVTRHGNQRVHYRQCWVRSAQGVELYDIPVEMLGEQ